MLDKNTGAVLWSDNSPGENVLTGQWSSPAAGILGGVEQVIFGGGDGWLYSFDPRGDTGMSMPLWKFDCNPKDSHFSRERSTRNPIISTPVIYDGLVYVAVGEDLVFKLSERKELIAEQNIGSPVYSTPIAANDVLYIAANRFLLAIGAARAQQEFHKWSRYSSESLSLRW